MTNPVDDEPDAQHDAPMQRAHLDPEGYQASGDLIMPDLLVAGRDPYAAKGTVDVMHPRLRVDEPA